MGAKCLLTAWDRQGMARWLLNKTNPLSRALNKTSFGFVKTGKTQGNLLVKLGGRELKITGASNQVEAANWCQLEWQPGGLTFQVHLRVRKRT